MKSQKSYKRIVVKVGSSVLTEGKTQLVVANLEKIVKHIADLTAQGKEVVLVTSGAIASGLSCMGISKRPTKLADLQAAAAIGQNILMQNYTQALSKYNLRCAQILLTREDFFARKRFLNAKNTILNLLSLKVIPIINENDTISVDEIKFGDNDMLSSLVSMLIEADGLEILSDIEGLCRNYDEDKKTYSDLIKRVKQITQDIEIVASGTDNATCIGGMESKIEAIKIATNMGIPVVLANGLNPKVRIDFSDPENSDGTYFEVSSDKKTSKKHWIAFGAQACGSISIDEGAVKAVLNKNASLLSPGVKEVTGEFDIEDVVDITDKDGEVVARGIINYSSQQLMKIKGKKSDKEVIHRDELVLLK